jgi:hypothetical protein
MSELDPRYQPRSYVEMLNDLVAMRDKMGEMDSTDARRMVVALAAAVTLADMQLERYAGNMVKRMVGGGHAVRS